MCTYKHYDLDMFLEILVVVSLAAISYWWYKLKKLENKLNWLPHVPGKPIIGNALDFRKSTEILQVLLRYVEKYNGICLLDIGTKKVMVITDYELLQFILSSTKILDKSQEYKFLNKWLGTGLLTAQGEKWKKTRKIITPAFHFSILEQFVSVFENSGKIMIDLLQKEVDKDSVDIYPYITMCTLDVICETAMGVSINAQINTESEYVFAVKEMCRIIIDRSFSPFKRNNIFYPLSKDYYKELKYVKTLHDYTDSVIKSRKSGLLNRTKEENGNKEAEQLGLKQKMVFLDLLLHATMDGKPLPDVVVREEVDTFMFEGHDTTSSAISFGLYCLANYLDVQVKAVEEQKLIFGKDRYRAATHRDLQEMKYLDLVIKETLRLYPSVPFFGRNLERDMEYKDGQIIPKGVSLFIFTYGIGRNAKFFPNPDKFDPSRFEDMDGSSPYSYIPFSAGPRNCIGQKFAMLELKSTISKILRNYELQPASPTHNLILVPETVLKSANGVRIKLRKRDWDC